MKIHRFKVHRMTIEDFADENGLVMEVRERSAENLPRYYAAFEDVWMVVDGGLSGTYGNGDTEELAIKAYAKKISENVIVLNGSCPGKRVEIRVPVLRKREEEEEN